MDAETLRNQARVRYVLGDVEMLAEALLRQHPDWTRERAEREAIRRVMERPQ